MFLWPYTCPQVSRLSTRGPPGLYRTYTATIYMAEGFPDDRPHSSSVCFSHTPPPLNEAGSWAESLYFLCLWERIAASATLLQRPWRMWGKLTSVGFILNILFVL